MTMPHPPSKQYQSQMNPMSRTSYIENQNKLNSFEDNNNNGNSKNNRKIPGTLPTTINNNNIVININKNYNNVNKTYIYILYRDSLRI